MTLYEECYFCKDVAELKVLIPVARWMDGHEKWVCRRCILLFGKISPFPSSLEQL